MSTLQLITSTAQHATIDGHTVEHMHTTLYDCVMLNGVLIFIDSNVMTVARVYDAVCRALRAKDAHTHMTPLDPEMG